MESLWRIGRERNLPHPQTSDALPIVPGSEGRLSQFSEEIESESRQSSPGCIDSLAGAEKEIHGGGRERKRRCRDTLKPVFLALTKRVPTGTVNAGATNGSSSLQNHLVRHLTRGEESGEKGMRRLYRHPKLSKSSTPARTAERSSFPPTSSAARMGPDFLLESPALVAPLPRNQGMSFAGSAD